MLCRKLGVTRGGYYAWLRRGQSQRHLDNAELLEKIVEVHQANHGTEPGLGGGITFIRVGGEWSYLSAVMDRHTRQIIGWSFAKDRSAGLVREALLMATQAHTPTSETIFHSDQGCEYASKEYRRLLESFGLRVSMSRKGHCWDNAYMESFYHSLKTDMVYFQKFRHLAEKSTTVTTGL